MIEKLFSSVIILFYFILCQASPIHDEDHHPLVIDTDCAMDDMRAIGMLLSFPEVEILGIIATEGTLLPEEGAKKIRSLLHTFGADSIPVFCGKTTGKPAPAWRDFNRSVAWGDRRQNHESFADAVSWLRATLESEHKEVSYVCLGPLSTLSAVLRKNHELEEKIHRIIWYNESPEQATGFNYTCDKASADMIINTKIRIDLISNLKKEASHDSSLYLYASKHNTALAALLSKTGSQPAIIEKKHPHHLNVADELVSAYYTNPELFDMTVIHPRVHIRYNEDYDLVSVKAVFHDMISGVYVSSDQVVFSAFPVKPEMYTYDVRNIIDSAIARHGIMEWKACVMTDEFHGHLGVFSIAGAKMGTLAREIFNVGPDVLKVKSYAGEKPPYSCLNDGIQVSTGSTTGQGLLTLADVEKTSPEAVFTHEGRSVRLKLKDEYLAMINRDIEEGIVKFGLPDDGYWKLVRRSALKYWLEWDRDMIFEVEEININN